ncbi:nicotinate-nucleotide--dimethylbenzimidazole phosphoribosyltransferase, partial [Pseudomonas syringae pv. pisi str. 1704B]
NPTAASAVACSLLECAAPLLVGPGTGLNAEGIQHKTRVIERALALHA